MKKVLVLLLIVFQVSCNTKPDSFSLGKKSMGEKHYLKASDYFKLVPPKSEKKDSAVILKKYCDSMFQAKETQKKISLCKSYITSFDNFDTETFGNDEEIDYFKQVGLFVTQSEHSQNNKLYQLAVKLEDKLIHRQEIEFPIMREDFIDDWSSKLWDVDIKVKAGNGSLYNLNYDYDSYSEIVFIGGVFAANAHKEEFENDIEPKLIKYRFKWAKYKWYEYDSDPKTYYLSSPSDSDITNY